VHEVLWDKGFRINTLVLGYQTWAVCGFRVIVFQNNNSKTTYSPLSSSSFFGYSIVEEIVVNFKLLYYTPINPFKNPCSQPGKNF
jgi:hypothetical protein